MERLTNTEKRPTKEQLYNRLAELEDKIESGKLVDTTEKVGKFIEEMEFDFAMLEYTQFVSAFVTVASFGAISNEKIVGTMQDFCKILRRRLFGEVKIVDD